MGGFWSLTPIFLFKKNKKLIFGCILVIPKWINSSHFAAIHFIMWHKLPSEQNFKLYALVYHTANVNDRLDTDLAYVFLHRPINKVLHKSYNSYWKPFINCAKCHQIKCTNTKTFRGHDNPWTPEMCCDSDLVSHSTIYTHHKYINVYKRIYITFIRYAPFVGEPN